MTGLTGLDFTYNNCIYIYNENLQEAKRKITFICVQLTQTKTMTYYVAEKNHIVLAKAKILSRIPEGLEAKMD
jgi:hypothetical protein